MTIARTKEEGRDLVRALIDTYQANRDYFHSEAFDETSTRTSFVDKLFEALGWDVTAPGPDREVVFHARHRITASTAGDEGWDADLTQDELDARAARTDVPDYGFHIGEQLRFYVEAKRPQVGIAGRDAPFQIKSYAWNRSLPFSVLTDFEHLCVYHSAARPDRNRPNDGVLGGYNLTCDQYITRWDRIWDLLSRDRVAAGAAAALAQSFTPRGGTPVDEAFLRDMEEWRQDLANDLLRRQSDLEFWQLEEATQRILDRLVFVRVVEDRDIEQGVILRKYARLTDSYRFLRGEFRRLDAFYNGQLFAEHFSERLEVSDHVIQTIIANLYAVDGSPYRFDTFQADFLGKVYERFLGKQFVPAGTTRVRLVDKPEVRHAGGVYYTPRWVVDHMVATAMGPLVSGKTPRQVARLRIVDPACGSGTFLLGVLDFLILWHERYYDANSKADTDNHFVGENGRRQLTTDFKGRILVNNVYGVDVDPRAVEVAQMSLYLRILEQETAASIGAQTRLFQGAHLPSLARNIRAGNSLISETDVPVALLADLDLRRRINPFDWRDATNGFGSVFTDENGFDVVIGNPPYTRVQEMRRSRPEETAIIEQHYGSAVAGFDIASLFTERALTLIKPRAGRNPGGRVTFITSRTFTETNAGTGIRGVLANGSHVHSIIDFGPGLVFAEAGAYTVILIATARSNSTWDLTRVPAPPSPDALLAAIQDPILHADLPATALPGNDSWPLALPAEDAILKRLSAAHPTLGRITGNVIFQGIVTGSDGVFRAVDLGPDPANPARRRVRPASAPNDSEPLFFESALLRPIYAGRSDFRPFWTARSREWVIMPYAPPHPGEAFMLLPWTRLAREAPEIAAWLQANENTLRERSGHWTDDNWYSYSRRQNLERFSRAKIMVPSMIDHLCATFDADGHFFVNVSTGGYGLDHDPASGTTPEYVAALLNSTLLSWILQKYSRAWRGGWFEARKGNLQRLPIPVPPQASQDDLVAVYHGVRDAVAASAAAPDDVQLRGFADTARRTFNHAVYAIYRLAISEIALIENA